MLRKVLFLTLVLSADNHVVDGNTTLIASVFTWDKHFVKADPIVLPNFLKNWEVCFIYSI